MTLRVQPCNLISLLQMSVLSLSGGKQLKHYHHPHFPSSLALSCHSPSHGILII